jgi:hypothetical protein
MRNGGVVWDSLGYNEYLLLFTLLIIHMGQNFTFLSR